MFTGVVETTGAVMRTPPALRISTALASELQAGESVSVDGSCLTVDGTDTGRDWFSAHVSAETARVTIARRYRRGTLVNLERAVMVGDRLGGHIVSGHIDGTAKVLRISTESDGSRRVRLGTDVNPSGLLVQRGSVTLNGISLTVTEVGRGTFEVVMVPLTMSMTTASEWRPGSLLNIEFDTMGKYVRSYMEGSGGSSWPEEDQ